LAEEELENLRDVYWALQGPDVDELRSRLAHDIEVTLPESLPWGGTRHGLDGIESLCERFKEHIDGSLSDPDDFLVAGDRVVVLGRMRGRIRRSGEEFEEPFVHVWDLSDGVPSMLRAYFDPVRVLRGL
jgi:ketosteroid isomerase-like protein